LWNPGHVSACSQSVSQFRRGPPALTPPSRRTAPRSPHDRMAVRFVCPCVPCVSRMVPVPPGVFLPVRLIDYIATSSDRRPVDSNSRTVRDNAAARRLRHEFHSAAPDSWQARPRLWTTRPHPDWGADLKPQPSDPLHRNLHIRQ